jgi:hypothetical protein
MACHAMPCHAIPCHSIDSVLFGSVRLASYLANTVVSRQKERKKKKDVSTICLQNPLLLFVTTVFSINLRAFFQPFNACIRSRTQTKKSFFNDSFYPFLHCCFERDVRDSIPLSCHLSLSLSRFCWGTFVVLCENSRFPFSFVLRSSFFVLRSRSLFFRSFVLSFFRSSFFFLRSFVLGLTIESAYSLWVIASTPFTPLRSLNSLTLLHRYTQTAMLLRYAQIASTPLRSLHPTPSLRSLATLHSFAPLSRSVAALTKL